jgi:monomeric sarcosine oxidase
MGSFAALELAQRGALVVGFDQFRPPHHRGSHGGETRIFRVAYREGSGYVPLVKQAGELWDHWGERFGTKLLHRVGLLHMGREEEGSIREVKLCANRNQLQLETLGWSDIRKRYPAFHVPETYVGLLDPEGGWLDVDAAVGGSLLEAKRLGASIRLDTSVLGWRSEGANIAVDTSEGSFTVRKLIVSAGAWTARILRDLKLDLRVRRKVVAWFEPLQPELFAEGSLPIFIFPENAIYGFPNIAGRGVKLAEHLGGEDLSHADASIAPPGLADLDPIKQTAAKYLPGLLGERSRWQSSLLRAETCLYTMSPDEHFILDHHPDCDNVLLAAGFSGHGFKFAPVIGRVLADWAFEGITELPVGFLKISRFSHSTSICGQDNEN